MKPKLLIVELWGLGDLVLATPFIRAAAEKYAVTLLAKPFAEEMQPYLWPSVDIIPFTAPWTAFRFAAKYSVWRWPWMAMWRVRRSLQLQGFDYAVSARWDPRDHFLIKLAGARERFGFPRWQSQRCLTQGLYRPDPAAHRSESWRVVASALDLKLPPRSEIFNISRPQSPVVLIHSGARLPLRVWPLENYLEIARRLRQNHYTVRIVCDEDQVAWWENCGEKAFCPATVKELMRAMDEAGVFIGNDSGPGHLAASCGLPTFTFFGPQLHEWFAPMHPAAEWIEGKACPYKPCSDYCRFPAPYCLWKINAEEAWAKIEPFVVRHLPAPDNPLKNPPPPA